MLSINNTKIYYAESGEGFPLVFTHAGIANSDMWQKQVDFFSKNYRVITYDMRGYGRSPQTRQPRYPYQDLVALLDALEIENCILIGCSMGAAISIDAYLVAPHRIHGLILVGGLANGIKVDPAIEKFSQMDQAIKAWEAGDIDKTNEFEVQMWADGYNQPIGRADKEIREKVREMNKIVLKNEKEYPDVQGHYLKPVAGERFDEINAPTLLITGNLDSPFILKANQIMLENLSNVKHYSVENTAHLPNMEKPEEFNQVVDDFIESILKK